MEFHISRRARDRYEFDDSIFSLSGDVVFANFQGARVFAQKINEKRDLARFPFEAIKPGQITAMGLIDEILHYVVSLYRQQVNPRAMEETLEMVNRRFGKDEVDRTLRAFADEFPTVAVYRGEIDVDSYLEGTTEEMPNRLVVLEEMILLWLANMNPAFSPFVELFDDKALGKNTLYQHIISVVREYFDTQPPFGPDHQHLIDMLRSPAIAVPDSLSGQLEYIRERWKILLETFLNRILKGLDLFKEEEKLTFHGPGRARVYQYKDTGIEYEAEQFSPDRDWMPRLVLMAKNVYVWLDQLSKKYGHAVGRLDEIPDGELEALRRQGFSGLWLIGIWERSPSSQRIKQSCGNPEAVPSAYSLYDYSIAADLGGEEAYGDLRDRAWMKGIRLASDMVPNHVGIYSRWTVDHPDWFVSLDYNPYPWYTFGGQDLSRDEKVSLFIEDHYYNCTDAAVVFKRVDRASGSEKYVYHGNDGTSMPWNDTAQLNYLNPEVREAMIRTILHVARKFPVIRFDAAMTLTKKHYQRLWFPEPGTGGAIPTRAEFGLTKEEFDRAMPKEFWREVVDRVAAEAPDTLLLAEAFWLLEGYFVRSLGMHRVYNSAFMHMLRDEDNAGYRQVMKNTLEFDPEVLRRFVNFMNNPDERTAVDQFGKENKYFGVCALMATMPGLPMFGHGQIEGFSEKYGMEYRRAYWDETPDPYLVERHEREIFPLLNLRYLFAGVDHFLLYDFFTAEGHVDEDVFAYSNRYGEERALTVYNNKGGGTSGWIRTSAAYLAKADQGEGRSLVRKTLAEGLELSGDSRSFTIFRDHISGLQFIRENGRVREEGLRVELGPYGYHVFLDFHQVTDNEWQHYSRLTSYLAGRGVPDMEKALKEMLLQPVHNAFRGLVNGGSFRALHEAYCAVVAAKDHVLPEEILGETEGRILSLLGEIKSHGNGSGNEREAAERILSSLRSLLLFRPAAGDDGIEAEGETEETPGRHDEHLFIRFEDDPSAFYTFLAWVLVGSLGDALTTGPGSAGESRRLLDEWLLAPVLAGTFEELGMDGYQAAKSTLLVKLLACYHEIIEAAPATALYERLALLFGDEQARQFLQVNEYESVLWFSRDSFRELLVSCFMAEVIRAGESRLPDQDRAQADEGLQCSLVVELCKASERAGYRVEHFLDIVKNEIKG